MINDTVALLSSVYCPVTAKLCTMAMWAGIAAGRMQTAFDALRSRGAAVPPELVQEALVIRVHQPTRLQMPCHRLLERSGATFKSRELTAMVVVLMPELKSLLQQFLQSGTEVACSPLLGPC